MSTLTSKIDLTDEQITAAFAAIGCDVDISGEYGEPHRFTVTSDTLGDFVNAREDYNKPGTIDEQTDTHLTIKDAAVRSGDQCHDYYIIDFGTARIICRV